MIKRNQDGAVNAVVISLIFAILFLIAAVVFGAWAFMSRQDYKDNVDAKISDAVVIAKQQESTAKDKQFVEKEKNPLRIYKSPDAFGGVTIAYPKTWSAYVAEVSSTSGNGGTPVDGYFNPSFVPSVSDTNSIFALRLKVLGQPYATVLSQFTSLQKAGKLKISPYALPKVPSVIGVRVTGTLPGNKTGSMVILPLRSQTIELWSEGSQHQNDFDNIILPNASFLP